VEALIFADPVVEAVTYPLEFTVATPLLLELQFTPSVQS
jgi:hypothetical protein